MRKDESAGPDDRPVVVLAAPGHQREDDAGDLVGERHRCQFEFVLDCLAREHAARPQAHGVVMALAMTKRRAGAYDQKLAQIAVAQRHRKDERRLMTTPSRTSGKTHFVEATEGASNFGGNSEWSSTKPSPAPMHKAGWSAVRWRTAAARRTHHAHPTKMFGRSIKQLVPMKGLATEASRG
jgi:hypothetical protein